MSHRYNDDADDTVQVNLYAPYDQEVKKLESVGALLDEAMLVARASVNADPYDLDLANDEIDEIGPALEHVHRQVRDASLHRHRISNGLVSTVEIRVPRRYFSTLRHWASVGRTFDNLRSVIRADGGNGALESRLREYQLPMEHLQKRVAQALLEKS